VHEFYLICDNIESFVAALKKHDIQCGPLHHQGWGVLTHVLLPGGGKLGVYEPRHARPKPMKAKSSSPRKSASRTTRKKVVKKKRKR
jgi:hypothetical protein